MARNEVIAVLLHLLFVVARCADGSESDDTRVVRNSESAVMITNQWQQNDCMTRNCLFGSYYETSNVNISKVIEKNHQIHLAVLMPSRAVDEMSERSSQILAATLPVIELAIQSVKEKKLLNGYELIVHHRDTNCSSTYGPMAAFDLYNRNEADVFLGPICDYVLAPVARYATVWQRPVLTTGGLSSAFNNKVEQNSLSIHCRGTRMRERHRFTAAKVAHDEAFIDFPTHIGSSATKTLHAEIEAKNRIFQKSSSSGEEKAQNSDSICFPRRTEICIHLDLYSPHDLMMFTRINTFRFH